MVGLDRRADGAAAVTTPPRRSPTPRPDPLVVVAWAERCSIAEARNLRSVDGGVRWELRVHVALVAWEGANCPPLPADDAALLT